jgi:predicted  nucleic acid-binding Zn-ribbon protein
MKREIKGLGSIKTLRKLKRKSISGAEGTDHAELYLLKNNLTMAKREISGVERRKKALEERISGMEQRITELEGKTPKKRGKKRNVPPQAKSPIQVLKVGY